MHKSNLDLRHIPSILSRTNPLSEIMAVPRTGKQRQNMLIYGIIFT